MPRKSERELERLVEDLQAATAADGAAVDLTDTQARAIREYDLHCESVADLDDDLRAALLEAVDERSPGRHAGAGGGD